MKEESLAVNIYKNLARTVDAPDVAHSILVTPSGEAKSWNVCLRYSADIF